MKELIILGHPDHESFCNQVAETYYTTAKKAGKDIQMIKLSDLDFSENLKYGYRQKLPLESDLKMAQNLISEADHIVWVFPIWWANIPAKMKGFIDRIFLPGWAFKNGSKLPVKLLKGKTSKLFITMDSPKWYYKYFLKEPIKYSFVKGTLNFCGIKN